MPLERFTQLLYTEYFQSVRNLILHEGVRRREPCGEVNNHIESAECYVTVYFYKHLFGNMPHVQISSAVIQGAEACVEQRR
jgi:hypothetical protein